MAKSTKSLQKVVDLDQDDLNESGIKTQLTQNDLLEVLVSERLAVIDKEITDVNNFVKDIIDELDNEREEFKAAFINIAVDKLKKVKIKVSKENLYNFHASYITNNEIWESHMIYKVIKEEYRSNESISSTFRDCSRKVFNTGTFDLQADVCFKVTTVVDDMSIETMYKVTVSMTHTFDSKAILDKIAKSNNMCNEIVAKYKNVNINYNSVLKDMRVKMNKKLIQNAAGGKLRAKILDNLGLSI
jgi:hypothetical protein